MDVRKLLAGMDPVVLVETSFPGSTIDVPDCAVHKCLKRVHNRGRGRPKKVPKVDIASLYTDHYIICLHERRRTLEREINDINDQLGITERLHATHNSALARKFPTPEEILQEYEKTKKHKAKSISTQRIKAEPVRNAYSTPSKLIQKKDAHQGYQNREIEIELPSKMAHCREVLQDLCKHSYAPPFLSPVDYVALGIPDYPTIITKPMDLGTISQNMKSLRYISPEEFICDVDLVFMNACTYNPSTTTVHSMALTLHELFKEKISVLYSPNMEVIPNSSSVQDTKEFAELQLMIQNLKAEVAQLRNNRKTIDKVSSFAELIDIPLTLEEKRILSKEIEKLPGPQLAKVVQKIRENMPFMDNSTETVIDIDLLDIKTQRSIEIYIQHWKDKATKQSKTRRAKRMTFARKVAKTKPILPTQAPGNEVQTQKIISDLEEQIHLLDGPLSQPMPTPIPFCIHKSTDSEESSEESSESNSEESSDTEQIPEDIVKRLVPVKTLVPVETIVVPVLPPRGTVNMLISKENRTLKQVNDFLDKTQQNHTTKQLPCDQVLKKRKISELPKPVSANQPIIVSHASISHEIPTLAEKKSALLRKKRRQELQEKQQEEIRARERERKKINRARQSAKEERERKLQEPNIFQGVDTVYQFAKLAGISDTPGVLDQLSRKTVSDLRSSLKDTAGNIAE